MKDETAPPDPNAVPSLRAERTAEAKAEAQREGMYKQFKEALLAGGPLPNRVRTDPGQEFTEAIIAEARVQTLHPAVRERWFPERRPTNERRGFQIPAKGGGSPRSSHTNGVGY